MRGSFFLYFTSGLHLTYKSGCFCCLLVAKTKEQRSKSVATIKRKMTPYLPAPGKGLFGLYFSPARHPVTPTTRHSVRLLYGI